MISSKLFEASTGISAGIGISALPYLLIRPGGIKRHTIRAWRGYKISDIAVGAIPVDRLSRRETFMVMFWWPGKRRWEERIVTKAMLLGAVFEFEPVTSWHYDKGWTVILDGPNKIVSSKKITAALSYIDWKLQDEA